jgi:hypothetical protein
MVKLPRTVTFWVRGLPLLLVLALCISSTAHAAPPSPNQRILYSPASQNVVSTPEPGPPPDYAEPNWDFLFAFRFTVGEELHALNFNSGYPDSIDNDFFVFAAHSGATYTCETDHLGGGANTNLILYGPTHSLINGNDDVDAGAGLVNSRVTFTSDYEGDTFVLVGYKPDAVNPLLHPGYLTYSLRCTEHAAPAESPAPHAEPVPAVEEDHAEPVHFEYRLLSAPTPVAPQTPTPLSVLQVQILIGYDENANGVLDLHEGVEGLSVRVVDALTNRELAHGFTDSQGALSAIVTAGSEVRVLVPFLSAGRTFRPGTPVTWQLLIPPGNQPGLIP